MGPKSLSIRSDQFPAGKSFLIEQMRRFAVENHWPPAIRNEVELILEEWLTNLLSWSFPGVVKPEIILSARTDGASAWIEVRDNGPSFNPLEQREPDITKAAEDRPLGGLGIFMMKKLSRKMQYERIDHWNVLQIEKDLRQPVLGRT